MKVTHNNIKDFLYTPNKYFVIPDFQRPYSWGKTNIDSLLLDIESALDKDKVHFFGSVVYVVENNDSVIIDGQQRSTTILLMLTALYHIAAEYPERCSIPAEQIMEQYLYNKFAARIGDEENRIKLRTVTTDNEIFERIFEKNEITEKHKESKLYRAYYQFYEYFMSNDRLERYIDVLSRFEIVTIALDAGDDNPQEVFESINSTGQPLTDGDKIRNFSLMLNDKEARQHVLETYWAVIERSLTDINKDHITDFFRMYLISKHQKDVKLEHVYPEFRRQFEHSIHDQSNIESLDVFYGEIIRYLQYYQFLKFNVDRNEAYTAFKDQGFRLNFLKIETVYPFIMRVLERRSSGELTDNDVLRVFTIIESYLVRRIICNIATSGLNKFFSILDKDIQSHLSEGTSADYVDVLIYILTERIGMTRFPTDVDVKNAISSNPFYAQRSWYNNFVLSSIDDKLQSKESALLRSIASGDIKVSIEHIMPQTLSKSWKEMLGENYDEIHDQYIHTLPNLTLTGYNSEYSNKPFEIKKTIEHGFDSSSLLINAFIRDSDVWNKDTLRRRADWWLEQIGKIWAMPETSYEAPNTDREYFFREDEDLKGTVVTSVSILGETSKVMSWADAFENIVEKLLGDNPELFDTISEDAFLSRYIRPDGDNLINPREISKTQYFLETGTDTNYKKKVIMKLLEYLDLEDEDIKVTIAR
ncbi:MAG: DUF262 domain-containing protein [Candidatus Saccharimonadales bacterium]